MTTRAGIRERSDLSGVRCEGCPLAEGVGANVCVVAEGEASPLEINKGLGWEWRQTILGPSLTWRVAVNY